MKTKNKKPTNEELQAMLEASRVTTSTVVPEEEYLMMIDDYGMFARGDIHAFKAAQKQGKTTALKVILATLIIGALFRLKSLVAEPRIVYFDTEQSLRDVKQILKDVQQMTGVDPDYLDGHVDLYTLRSKSPEELRYLLLKALEDKHPEVVFIDGLVELVHSFNEEAEAKQVIQGLLKLAEIHHCAIIVVLHTNKAEDDHHMRGHLGTMLAQKAATVFECVKSGAVITVKCTDARHHSLPSWSITYDAEGHIQDATTLEEELLQQAKANKEQRKREEAEHKRQSRMESCTRILDEAGGSLPRKELVEKLKEKCKVGHSVLQTFIKEQLESRQLHLVNGKIQTSEE